MKSIDNKIIAIGLSGLIIGGFISSSAVKVYANFVIDPSSGLQVPLVDLNEKFNPELYPKNYPVLDVPLEYIYRIRDPKDVLPKGNDSGIDKIYRALNGSGFQFIKISGNRSVIDDFVKDIEEPMLKKPQLCFRNIDKFREYILSLQQKKKPEEGVYRFMIGGFEGLFYFKPSKLLNLYDKPMIDLQYIQRNEGKYGYKVLDFNFDGMLILKKYKEPIILGSVEEFFSRMDIDKRKRPGYFGNPNHGGVQIGGIYCIRIDDLVVLFRALK